MMAISFESTNVYVLFRVRGHLGALVTLENQRWKPFYVGRRLGFTIMDLKKTYVRMRALVLFLIISQLKFSSIGFMAEPRYATFFGSAHDSIFFSRLMAVSYVPGSLRKTIGAMKPLFKKSMARGLNWPYWPSDIMVLALRPKLDSFAVIECAGLGFPTVGAFDSGSPDVYGSLVYGLPMNSQSYGSKRFVVDLVLNSVKGGRLKFLLGYELSLRNHVGVNFFHRMAPNFFSERCFIARKQFFTNNMVVLLSPLFGFMESQKRCLEHLDRGHETKLICSSEFSLDWSVQEGLVAIVGSILESIFLDVRGNNFLIYSNLLKKSLHLSKKYLVNNVTHIKNLWERQQCYSMLTNRAEKTLCFYITQFNEFDQNKTKHGKRQTSVAVNILNFHRKNFFFYPRIFLYQSRYVRGTISLLLKFIRSVDVVNLLGKTKMLRLSLKKKII